jgi:hypothetical protein
MGIKLTPAILENKKAVLASLADDMIIFVENVMEPTLKLMSSPRL